jgi:hypothetical protein
MTFFCVPAAVAVHTGRLSVCFALYFKQFIEPCTCHSFREHKEQRSSTELQLDRGRCISPNMARAAWLRQLTMGACST